MTHSQLLTSHISANDLFKRGYGKYLRWATLAALFITVLVFLLTPKYVPTPYTLRNQEIVILNIETIQDIEIPKEIPPPPVIPICEIEPTSGPIDKEYELPDTSGLFPPWNPTPTGIITRDDGFVASSTKPALLFQARPDYPEIARLAKLEGTVIVNVLVGVDGLVRVTEVVQSVHPLLDKAAVKAAKRCRFKAGTQRAIAVKTWVTVPYTFRLQ